MVNTVGNAIARPDELGTSLTGHGCFDEAGRGVENEWAETVRDKTPRDSYKSWNFNFTPVRSPFFLQVGSFFVQQSIKFALLS